MFSPWTCRILRLGFFLSICALGLSSAHAQQIGVSWTGNAGTGNWNDPTNWNPAVVPDNAGSTTYSVTINAPNEGASVFGAVFGAGLTIDNLTLGSTNGLGGDDAIISLVSGASTNNGSISLDLSTLSINSGASLLNNGSIGLLQSTLNINSGASFINNGPISQELLPAFLYNNGSFVNNSEISEIADGNIINDGSGQFANLGTIYLDSGHFTNVGTFNNTGAITLVTLSDPIDFTNSGTFNNGGTINISIINVAGSTFSNSGTLNNASTINLDYLPECCFSLSNSGTLNTLAYSTSPVLLFLAILPTINPS